MSASGRCSTSYADHIDGNCVLRARPRHAREHPSGAHPRRRGLRDRGPRSTIRTTSQSPRFTFEPWQRRQYARAHGWADTGPSTLLDFHNMRNVHFPPTPCWPRCATPCRSSCSTTDRDRRSSTRSSAWALAVSTEGPCRLLHGASQIYPMLAGTRQARPVVLCRHQRSANTRVLRAGCAHATATTPAVDLDRGGRSLSAGGRHDCRGQPEQPDRNARCRARPTSTS